MIFEDVYAFDEAKKRREIEERTTEIRTLYKQAELKLQGIKADAEVSAHHPLLWLVCERSFVTAYGRCF